MDPQQAAIASLSREVQLLRAENAYLRGQVRPVPRQMYLPGRPHRY